jgi:hypothetical protein
METPSLAAERRACARQTLSVPVLIEHVGRRPGPPFLVRGRLRDISNKGVFLWAPPLFRTGQELRIDLEIPSAAGPSQGLKIGFHAHVVRTEPGEPGTTDSGIAARILRSDTPRIVPCNPDLRD